MKEMRSLRIEKTNLEEINALMGTEERIFAVLLPTGLLSRGQFSAFHQLFLFPEKSHAHSNVSEQRSSS